MANGSETASEMTAIAITGPGGPEVLEPVRRPVPKPGAGEILIRVAAAGVNRPDAMQRAGHYPAPPGHSELPGLEVAGTVVATGTGAGRFAIGTAVMALLNGGGYAEYAIAPEGSVLPVPAGLDLIAAAGVPETAFTVWHNVFERGRLSAGEWLLVHGGSSGIGTMAVQLGAAFGARVIATVGSEAKAKAVEALGATRAVNYRTQDFVAAVADLTDRHGADVILDMVGGSYLGRNFAAAAEDGRIVQIATQEAPVAEIDLRRLMLKRLTLTGSTLRARTNAFKAALARAVEAQVSPLLASGRVRPLIHATLPLSEATEAHRLLEAGTHIGKIVLVVP